MSVLQQSLAGFNTAASVGGIDDQFTGTNGASLSGRTPDTADVGTAWVNPLGTMTIESGAAQSTGTETIAVIDSLAADADVEVKYLGQVGGGGTSAGYGVIMRYQSAGNYILFYFAAGGVMQIYKCVSGSFVEIGLPRTIASGAGLSVNDVIATACNGSALAISINGVSIATEADSTYSTATKHGIRHNGAFRTEYFTASPI